MSKREDPNGLTTQLRRHANGQICRASSSVASRRDASGRIYRASSSITSVESMRLACAPHPPSTAQRQQLVTHHNQRSQRQQPVTYHSQVRPPQRQQPVKYHSSGPAALPSSISLASSSSSMPTNSRFPYGGSFWTKGKGLLSKFGRRKGSLASNGDSASSKGTVMSDQYTKTQMREDGNKYSDEYVSSKGTAMSDQYTETQMREDGNEYSDEYVDERYVEDYDESVDIRESLDTNAERRAVIIDSWGFFRKLCSLLRDKRKYDEVFLRMQLDPVFPYLDSMMGMNDSVDDVPRENAGANKSISQAVRDEYYTMSKSAIARDLAHQAEVALPSLTEICKALATSLGIEEYAVGPVKDARSALRKAEEKYEGDVLKVTDYCRAMIVVEDFPTLLALLELASDTFSPLIRRVKLSALQTYRASKPGGYRDCIINLELKDHICEIAVHLQCMWEVCGVNGFSHYRHCLEYSIDTFSDPKNVLAGLDRKTVAELIAMAEEAVSGMPLETLEWHHEEIILDYFCEALLFLDHRLNELAETTLNKLIKLRCQNPNIGPDHPETIALYGYLKQALQEQSKNAEADVVASWITESDQKRRMENAEAEKSIWDQLVLEPIESIIDPGKVEREMEEKIRKEALASKQAWEKIRQQRFKFLDGI
ncbi:hypothetical protein ACHAXA_000293 [Cyclostephanos tholiformis]|uniref:Uncharacterized protein n=1 Tax=Cyclostephanos tholiformis TaxID=382380 RepID=A0ABD3R7T8_9STRA